MPHGGRTYLGYREPKSQKSARRGFNAGVWVVYNGPAAKRLFDGRWALMRAATWRPLGEVSTCPGSEQWEFEVLLGLTGAKRPRDVPSRELDSPTSVAKRSLRVGVALNGDGSFCDQGRPRPPGATPFLHFAGCAQWLGKSQIRKFLAECWQTIPVAQRAAFPNMQMAVRSWRHESEANAAQRFRRGREKIAKGIRDGVGVPVRVGKKTHGSLRAAERSTGKSRYLLKKAMTAAGASHKRLG